MGLVERSFALVVLTRADGEHLPGMVAALDRYPAGLQIGPAGSNVSSLEQRWRAAGSPNRLLTIDAPISLDVEPDVVVDIYPTPPFGGQSAGDASPQRSLIVRIQHGSVATLIASSATPSEIGRAASTGWNVSADALVIPKHGGKDALDEKTVGLVGPSVAVISVSPRNRDGAPTKETLGQLERLQVFRTDLHGAIELTTDGNSLRVIPGRSP
jgi:competence protein ComEC